MDKDIRELSRKTATGDTDAAAQLAVLGGRAMRGDLIREGIVGALPALSIDELRKIGRDVMAALAVKEEEDKVANPKAYKDVKATEIHMPDLGKISIAALVTVLEDLVNDCVQGQARKNPHIKAISGTSSWRGGGSYGRSTTGGKSKDVNARDAEKAFAKVSGQFLISCSSPLRIYALQTEPPAEELAERKKTMLKQKLEEELETKSKLIAKAKKEAAQATQKLEKIKAKLNELNES